MWYMLFRFVSEVRDYVWSGGRFAFGGIVFGELFFGCGHGSVLLDLLQFLIYCEAAPSVVEAGYGWVSFECCRLKLTFRELVFKLLPRSVSL